MVASQRTRPADDHQSGRTVVAAAIILPVLAAINAVVAGHAAVGVIAAVAIITIGIVRVITLLVTVIIILVVAPPILVLGMVVVVLGAAQLAVTLAQIADEEDIVAHPAKLTMALAHLALIAALRICWRRHQDRRCNGDRNRRENDPVHDVIPSI